MKALKISVILILVMNVYTVLAWTYVFYAYDTHDFRVECFDTLTAGMMNTTGHLILLGLNILALVSLSRIPWSRYLKAVLIGFYLFFILFGIWGLM